MQKILSKALAGEKNTKPFITVTKKGVSAVIISVLSFFAGRVTVFQGLNPIAIAFLCTFLYTDKTFYGISFFLALGFLTNSGIIYLSKYLICLIIINIFNLSLRLRINSPSLFLKAATGGMSVLISGLIIAFLNSFSFYYTILAFLEAVLTFSLSFVLKKGSDIIYFESDARIIDNDELLSLSILTGALIAGSADVYIGSISLTYCFLMLTLLIVSCKNGASAGCGAGILLTSVLMLSGSLAFEETWIFSVSAMAAGASKKGNKAASAVIFIISCVMGFLYINKELITQELIFSGILALIMFFIIPINFWPTLASSAIKIPDTASACVSRIRDITEHRLKGFADSFSKLAKTFSSLSEKRTTLSKEEVAELIDDVAEKMCGKCNMRVFCWQNNFYNTYQTFFGILASCEKNGKVSYDDIPADFQESCINADIFAETTNRMFELYKINLSWKNKITESRELVSRQIWGMSEIINNLAYELSSETVFDEDMAKNLTEQLIKKHIKVEGIAVTENKNKKTEVIINHNSCYGRHFCLKEIIPAVNEALGKNMCKSMYRCSIANENGKSICKLKLIEDQSYIITTGIARAAKANSKESGDSYTFMDLENGSYLLAISDGMGSGAKAREESGASIELFENFMEAGFDKDTAIQIINSVLVLKSEPNSFSTLDICTINMYTGLCEFAKIGAAPTYLICGEGTEVIKSTSLPVGMLNSVDMETYGRELRDSDIIVMVTDGVCDSADNSKDDWIEKFLSNCKSKEPQTIADLLLNAAKENYQGEPNDDMTVLTAKIRKKI